MDKDELKKLFEFTKQPEFRDYIRDLEDQTPTELLNFFNYSTGLVEAHGYVHEGKYEDAKATLVRVLTIAEGLGALPLVVQVKYRLAQVLRWLSQNRAALAFYSDIIQLASDDLLYQEYQTGFEKLISIVGPSLGGFWQGTLHKELMYALYYAFDALVDCATDIADLPISTLQAVVDAGMNYVDSIQHPEWKHMLYLTRGYLYEFEGKHQTALEEYRMALDLRRVHMNTPGLPFVDHLMKVGEALVALERYEEAHEYFEEILVLPNLGEGYRRRALAGVGECILVTHGVSEALNYAEMELTVARSTHDDSAQRSALSFMGFIQARLGNVTEASSCSAEMVSLTRHLESTELRYRSYLRCGEVRFWQARVVMNVFQTDILPDVIPVHLENLDLILINRFVKSAYRWLSLAEVFAKLQDRRTTGTSRQDRIERLRGNLQTLVNILPPGSQISVVGGVEKDIRPLLRISDAEQNQSTGLLANWQGANRVQMWGKQTSSAIPDLKFPLSVDDIISVVKSLAITDPHEVMIRQLLAEIAECSLPANAEERIQLLKQLEALVTPEDDLPRWLIATHELANSYMERPTGDPSSNVETAINYLQSAWAFAKSLKNDQVSAMILDTLGGAYRQRIKGIRSRNIEKSIRYHRTALSKVESDNSPKIYATVCHNLANAYLNRIEGRLVVNIRYGLHYARKSLNIKKSLEDVAGQVLTLIILANAYKALSVLDGSNHKNSKRASTYYYRALGKVTFDQSPYIWATIHYNLGALESSRYDDPRLIEKARAHLHKAKKVITRKQYPFLWARIQEVLCSLYTIRIKGDRADNLERSIQCGLGALKIVKRREIEPILWGLIHQALAHAYLERVRESHAQNVEDAIEYALNAIEVLSPENNPYAWALAHQTLGSCYMDRQEGDRSTNLEYAAQHYETALTEFSYELRRLKWAEIQNSLYGVYLERGRLWPREHVLRQTYFDQARGYLENCLTFFTKQEYPFQWAGSQYNYAVLLADWPPTDSENIEAGPYIMAVAHCHLALEVSTRENYPHDWAEIQHHLGICYSSLSHGLHAENIKIAEQCFQLALQVRTRDTLPYEHFVTERSLGWMYFKEQLWQESYEAYSTALETGLELITYAPTEPGRQSMRADIAVTLTDSLLLAQAFAASEAIEVLETGKAREIAQALSMRGVEEDGMSAEQREYFSTLRNKYAALNLEYALPQGALRRRPSTVLAQELKSVRTELKKLLDQVRPVLSSDGATNMTSAQIASIVPSETVFVMPFFTQQGGYVFLVPHGKSDIEHDDVLILEELTEVAVQDWLYGDNGVLVRYLDYRFNNEYDFLDSRERWKKALDRTLSAVWNAIFAEVYPRLKGLNVRRIILFPFGGLGVLPLHAAYHLEAGHRNYLIDYFEVTYAPSAFVLADVQRRRESIMERDALIVGVSHYSQKPTLKFVKSEVETIAEYFENNARLLLDSDANVSNVLSLARDANYLHFACHASFNWLSSISSSELAIGANESLTMSQIANQLDLHNTQIVALSACETGISNLGRVPDEFVGLSSAFLQAGARSVISSLWVVGDRSTALIMGEFYRLHLEKGVSPPAALREAQLRLRTLTAKELGDYYASFFRLSSDEAMDAFLELTDSTNLNDKPYEDPINWAAFIMTGM
ncbi:MAG: CHAT domain-containing protein [Chloroflexi bacterium]|nr:CHAT domain-containing protein [Chloroflexota bacterium]